MIALILGIFLAGFSQAQYYPVQVTFSIFPPYTPGILQDYSHISATLISVEPVEGYLAVSLEGEGGIFIQTRPGYKPPAPLPLAPSMPYIINHANWQEAVNLDHLVFTGISQNEIIANGLPEGQYTMCVRVLDFMTGEPLSGEPPMGCAGFMISALSPPHFIDMTELLYYPTLEHANIISWMTDPATPPDSYFILAGKRVPAGMNGYEAWESPAVPFTFERKAMTSYYYLSGNDLGDIAPDLAYIIGVQVIGPAGMPGFQNNGWSEPYLFYIGHETWLAHDAAKSKGEPAPHLAEISSNQHETADSKKKHDPKITKTWPGGHLFKKSESWGLKHEPEVSKTWPPNHSAGNSNSWKAPDHTPQKSSTWPPDHHQDVSVSWPVNHPTEWPGDHLVENSNNWRTHKPLASRSWPPNHNFDISRNWKEKFGHSAAKSPTWPRNHEYKKSEKWPDKHCAEVSRKWPANHEYEKTKLGGKK